MIISLINRSKTVTDEVAQTVVRAINRQITQDFAPYWSFGATLRLEGAIGEHPNLESLSDMRGDAVLYLVDGTNSIGATGWHTTNYKDIPYGLVFLGLCEELHEPWSITLSHEALELLGDPMGNPPVCSFTVPYRTSYEAIKQFNVCYIFSSDTLCQSYCDFVM